MAELETHHVGIVVDDLEESVAFYRDTLGLDVAAEFTLSGDGIGTAIGVDGVTGDFAHLEGNGAIIELIEYEPAGADVGADAVNESGAKHVGFLVEDIEAFHDDLPASADPVSGPQTTESGSKIMFFRDPEGNFIEVIES